MEGCARRSIVLALCTIGTVGLMIAASFSSAPILIVGGILCLTACALARFGVRTRGWLSAAGIRGFIAPTPHTGACESCGDGRGYYIGDGRYLACKICGGRE